MESMMAAAVKPVSGEPRLRSYPGASRLMKREGELWRFTRHRRARSLNNRVEQYHHPLRCCCSRLCYKLSPRDLAEMVALRGSAFIHTIRPLLREKSVTLQGAAMNGTWSRVKASLSIDRQNMLLPKTLSKLLLPIAAAVFAAGWTPAARGQTDNSLTSQSLRIENWHVSFSLPADWIVHPGSKDTGDSASYIFGKYLIDDSGNEIIPTCSFLFEKTPLTDVVKWAAWKRVEQQFHTDMVFYYESGIIQMRNAVGFKGSFALNTGETRDLIVVFAIDVLSKTGLEVICEAPSGLFGQVEQDYLLILGSLSFTS
jgi:hypothetical protein